MRSFPLYCTISPQSLILLLAAVLALPAGCGPKGEQAADGDAAVAPAESVDDAAAPSNGEPDDATPDADAGRAGDTATEESPEAPAEEAAPPESMRDTFNRGIEVVRATGIEDDALGVGDKAVDGELIDSTGETVRLSELWNEKPLVVVWYRGGWCPFCNGHLKELQAALPQINDAGATVVAISPELPEKAADTAANNELAFTVLTDLNNELARQYKLVFKLPDFIEPIYRERIQLERYNGDDSYELPLSATYVIDRDGVIRYAFLDADYKQRAEPQEILAALAEL
ncbi:MAG: peroxiredoxin [Planctomycetaceae bacterium]|nr:peroxiredoxin [Planctomycetaceae bacterium]